MNLSHNIWSSLAGPSPPTPRSLHFTEVLPVHTWTSGEVLFGTPEFFRDPPYPCIPDRAQPHSQNPKAAMIVVVLGRCRIPFRGRSGSAVKRKQCRPYDFVLYTSSRSKYGLVELTHRFDSRHSTSAYLAQGDWLVPSPA